MATGGEHETEDTETYTRKRIRAVRKLTKPMLRNIWLQPEERTKTVVRLYRVSTRSPKLEGKSS